MANLAGIGGLAGGIAEGLISGEELKLKERAEKRAEQAERRQGLTAALGYIEKMPDLAKLDPSVRSKVFSAYLQGAKQLGLDTDELERFAPEFASIPGTAQLYTRIVGGKGTVEDEAKLAQLAPDMHKSALAARTELQDITLGKTVEAERAEGAGGERAEIAAREAPGLGVTPARARAAFGPTGAETGARAGAEAFAQVKARAEADPERRAVELDLLRAQAEAARRGPAASQAKAKLQDQALTAWHKINAGQPVTANEERWGLLTEQELVRFITGGDVNALEAAIAALAERQVGGAAPRKPIKPPKGEAAQGDKLSRKDARYDQLRRRGLTDEQIAKQFNVQITE